VGKDDAKERWTAALGDVGARESWRALSALDESPELLGLASGAPPRGVSEPPSVSRRALVKLLGASMALAGAPGCAPHEPRKILPYTESPPGVVPGLSSRYATSMALDGVAMGLLVESRVGRPVKIEGNPAHPASLGATGVFEQASILGLYDPYRARAPRIGDGTVSREALFERLGAGRSDGGKGLRVLLPPTSSPLVAALIERARARLPEARFTFWSPVAGDEALSGARLAFGRALSPVYDLREAETILALDADLLASMGGSVRYAHDFAQRRRPDGPGASMSRLYVVEPMISATGTLADHRIREKASEIVHIAAAIAAELLHGARRLPEGLSSSDAAALAPRRPEGSGGRRATLRAIAEDLARSGPRAVAIVGDRQPPVVHALGHVINACVASRAVRMIAPVLIDAGPATQGLAELAVDLAQGEVDTLVMLETNPVYDAPADLGFGELVARVPTSVKVGLYEDESARASRCFIPARHYLESWGDARAFDGTVSFVQPLIRPLFDGTDIPTVLAVLAGEPFPDTQTLLRERWRGSVEPGGPVTSWEEAIQRGFLPGTASPKVDVRLQSMDIGAMLPPASPGSAGALEVAFLPSPAVYDGRFADNPWLIELPRPITKQTWGNAAMMSAGTAARLGITTGDVVALTLHERTIEIPAMIVRGHADDAVSVDLGFGRGGAEEVARDVGTSAYRIRTSKEPWFARGVSIRRTGKTETLAIAQLEQSQHERPIALRRTLRQYREQPGFAAHQKGPVASLFPAWEQQGDQWAMTIDMTICTGCSACVVACQAENNVLVVGKEEVIRGREMHWLRIDQYLSGEGDEVEVVSQPMLCQHCEKAPCEYVCPVNATVHSPDGLNEMVYNRCIGTRFCSNNCPYKVRRFNWFDWNAHVPYNGDLRKAQKNPEVTVRARGVMEKCTYCVQRIRKAEIDAQIDRRPIRPGEVVTACQAACPTSAIQFGSLRHTETKMVKWREEPRAYAVLHELGTVPRTEYLAKIENPNPEIR
jgi:Fe-S-cluster-containing dehydrogenase component